MFTVLDTRPKAGRMRRKIISEKITYSDGEFYLSYLLSRKKDNSKFIGKFIRDCSVPVIVNGGGEVLEYKYRILLNTVCRYADSETDIAIFDPSGRISYLLQGAVEHFRTVYVVSDNPDYDTQNEILLSTVGTCAVMKEKIDDINGCDHIITSERFPFSAGPYVFGEHGWFVGGCTPVFSCNFPTFLPEDADVFSVAAGIEKYIGNKKAGQAFCTQFSLKGVKADAANFFK